MVPKNLLSSPLGKIRDTAVGALTDPKGTAGAVLHHAKGTAALGRAVVGSVASEVASHVPGMPGRPGAETADSVDESAELRPIPTEGSTRPHGDPLAPGAKSSAETATAATPKRAPGRKSAATKAPATKTTAKQTPARKATPAKATGKKPAARKAPSKKAAVTDPALRGGAQDELVYTTETPATPTSDRAAGTGGDEQALIDPAVAKKIAAEAERGRRDAESS